MKSGTGASGGKKSEKPPVSVRQEEAGGYKNGQIYLSRCCTFRRGDSPIQCFCEDPLRDIPLALLQIQESPEHAEQDARHQNDAVVRDDARPYRFVHIGRQAEGI